MTATKKKRGRWIRNNAHLLDIALAAAVVFAAQRWWHDHTIADLSDVGRRALYQQTASTAATLFGFTLTGITLLAAAADKALPGFPKGVPAATREKVLKAGLSLLYVLGLTLIAAFVLLVIDTDAPAKGATNSTGARQFPHSLCLFLPALVVMRTARVMWLLRVLVPSKPANA